MSYNPNQSPLVCIFNDTAHSESSNTSYAEFTNSLFEGSIKVTDNTVFSSMFNLVISGDVRYSFSGSGGLRSVSYFEINTTDTVYRGRNENGGGSGTKGVSPEIFFAKTESNDQIKLETKKKSSATIVYSEDYSRIIGLVS
tara:strand:+ start:105 stop:527 length:423 start_codon:yes stop_codon:yes gene_type:complete